MRGSGERVAAPGSQTRTVPTQPQLDGGAVNHHSIAAVVDAFGDASLLQLRHLPRRAPGRGEIEVMVKATSVNPIDVRRCSGYGRKLFSLLGAARMPLVLGNDFVGVVAAVGRGATYFREGDEVFGAKPPSSAGSHATHIVVKEEHATWRPPGISVSALATLPYNFHTVARAFAGAGINSRNVRGRDVLVHGASGRLGLLAVRTLAIWGAHVTTVSGSTGTEACRRAGAVRTIDRSRTSLRTLQPSFAATLNFANWDDEAALLRLLANDALGHATTVHPLLGNFDSFGLLRGGLATMREKGQMRKLVPHGARYTWSVFAPDSRALEQLACHAGIYADLAPYKEFALADTVLAHRHVAQRQPERAVLIPAYPE
jgi:D-arabinose 1-dehydrogenase-like Zn-dependent alcohol dehydrogenase